MLKVRKGDTVTVIKGKDKGKKGKVLEVSTDLGKAIVEGINTVKKHRRQTRQGQQGGIATIEQPIRIANIMVVCKNCNKPARIGFVMAKDGSKSRICKKCKEVM